MLAGAVRHPAALHCDEILLNGSLLPFLYHTNTIQQRLYTKVSRGSKTSGIDESQRSAPLRNPAIDAGPYRQGRKWQRPLLHNSEDGKVVTRLVKLDRPVRPTSDDPFSEAKRDARPRDDTSDRRRKGDARPALRTDGVPFEDAAQDAVAGFSGEKSTITPRERMAFEKLFQAQKVREKSKADEQVKTRARAGKTQVRTPDRELGLDDILDNAVDNIKTKRERPKPRFPDALRPMAEEARAQQKARAADTRETARNEIVKKDFDRVNGLMDKAETDLDLWDTLQEYVLNRVAALELDPATTPHQQAAMKAWEATKARLRKDHVDNQKAMTPAKRTIPFFDRSNFDLETLTANLPAHLLHFLELMRTTYPSSLLPLNLLPTLKSLGPSAFALGASTQLYNAHLTLIHSKYPTNLPGIIAVLEEMDREVYGFDDGTLEAVAKVLKTVNRARYGHDGPGVRALYTSEKVKRGVVGLEKWLTVIRERREEEALRRAREEESVREAERREESEDGMERDSAFALA